MTRKHASVPARTSGTSVATSASPLFAGCTAKERARIDSLSTPVEVKAGYELTHEGGIAKEFGVIVSGSASVTIGGQQVATLIAGDYYGEVGLLNEIGHTDGRRMATVTAETDMVVLAMSVAEFRTMLDDVPTVGDAVREAARERAMAASS